MKASPNEDSCLFNHHILTEACGYLMAVPTNCPVASRRTFQECRYIRVEARSSHSLRIRRFRQAPNGIIVCFQGNENCLLRTLKVQPNADAPATLLDFFPFADEGLAITVADASGKGLAAALMISNVQSSLRTAALLAGGDLATMTGAVNALWLCLAVLVGMMAVVGILGWYRRIG